MHNNYREQVDFLSSQYDELDGYDFYRYIFPNNENKGEFNTDFSKPNAIYLYTDEKDKDSERAMRRRIMLNDTWEDDYMEFIEQNPSTLCSGLSYRQRSNKIANAQHMNALVIDLDGVGYDELRTLFLRFGKAPENIRTLPTPTFLVSSGSGLHVYYVFDKPIELFPNIKLQLKKLKYDLTFRIWEYKSTSQEKEIQYQSINQGFRMVGSINTKYEPPIVIKAFKIGDKVSLDYINQYVREDKRVDVLRPFRPSKMTREQAKESYPEWYQRVVVNKEHKLKKWNIKDKVNGSDPYALYHWWIRQADQIKGGHRYFFMMCMSIYACKCDVPKKKLKEDMYEVLDRLKGVEHKNALTEKDINSALEAYDKEYYNFKIDDIEHLTDITIKRNERKGRKQAIHLRLARNQLKMLKELGETSQGRKPKEQLVKDYLQEHPTDNPTQVARALKISRSTVYKYMK